MNNKLLKLSALSILLAAAAPVSSFAQTSTEQTAEKKEKNGKEEYLLALNESTGKYEYNHIYVFDSATISQEQAYKNAKSYILSTLKTADNNIINDDKTFAEILNHGSLVLKPIHGFGWTINSAIIDFKVHLLFKNGRYKLIIDNLTYRAENMAPNPDMGAYSDLKNESVGKKFKKAVNESLADFVNGLKLAIINQSGSNSSW